MLKNGISEIADKNYIFFNGFVKALATFVNGVKLEYESSSSFKKIEQGKLDNFDKTIKILKTCSFDSPYDLYVLQCVANDLKSFVQSAGIVQNDLLKEFASIIPVQSDNFVSDLFASQDKILNIMSKLYRAFTPLSMQGENVASEGLDIAKTTLSEDNIKNGAEYLYILLADVISKELSEAKYSSIKEKSDYIKRLEKQIKDLNLLSEVCNDKQTAESIISVNNIASEILSGANTQLFKEDFLLLCEALPKKYAGHFLTELSLMSFSDKEELSDLYFDVCERAESLSLEQKDLKKEFGFLCKEVIAKLGVRNIKTRDFLLAISQNLLYSLSPYITSNYYNGSILNSFNEILTIEKELLPCCEQYGTQVNDEKIIEKSALKLLSIAKNFSKSGVAATELESVLQKASDYTKESSIFNIANGICLSNISQTMQRVCIENEKLAKTSFKKYLEAKKIADKNFHGERQ